MRPAGILALTLVAGCAHVGSRPQGTSSDAPVADSVTVALWRMDEAAGTRVADAGPFRLAGTTGRSVEHPFGRYGSALGFELSLDSFVYVPYDPELDAPSAMTVEAWVEPSAFGLYEDTPIAGRWTEEPNQQSWLFSISGRRITADQLGQGPGFHVALFPDALAGKLLFAYQPEAAGPPRVYVSTRTLELDRWTHVAVVFDGQVVRFFIDGELDSQFASLGRIRASQAPVLIGNYFDPRTLTGFGGDLHPNLVDPTPYYAFQGRLDELRLSRAPRRSFPTRSPR